MSLPVIAEAMLKFRRPDHAIVLQISNPVIWWRILLKAGLITLENLKEQSDGKNLLPVSLKIA